LTTVATIERTSKLTDLSLKELSDLMTDAAAAYNAAVAWHDEDIVAEAREWLFELEQAMREVALRA
jgi:hypothetical protein